MNEKRTAGEALDEETENVVAKANAIQVRRRSLEELDEETQWVIVGKLKLLGENLDDWAAEIDAELSAILDKKMES